MAGTYKIMIADDFPILREDLAEVIREQPDMEVVGEASTGKEIVALAENMDYDLILMDIEMETMNAGITATEMIRDKNPQAKIIFLTAHELREIIITAMGAVALDYIVKGCSDEEILYHIRCALNFSSNWRRMPVSSSSIIFSNVTSACTRSSCWVFINSYRSDTSL